MTGESATRALTSADVGWCVVPVLIIGAGYELFLGPRHDYTGHFVAGYAGSLGAMAVWLKTLSADRFRSYGVFGLGAGCIVCILIGAFLEATAFRIAKFDEIDFCNQSLGAVLATMVLLRFTGDAKPADAVFDQMVLIAVILLGIGGFFAVA